MAYINDTNAPRLGMEEQSLTSRAMVWKYMIVCKMAELVVVGEKVEGAQCAVMDS